LSCAGGNTGYAGAGDLLTRNSTNGTFDVVSASGDGDGTTPSGNGTGTVLAAGGEADIAGTGNAIILNGNDIMSSSGGGNTVQSSAGDPVVLNSTNGTSDAAFASGDVAGVTVSAGRPTRSRWCKSTAMKEWRTTSAPSRVFMFVRAWTKGR
jgi:hypothetical protein